MNKYKKRPVVVEAVQFTGTKLNYEMIEEWSGGAVYIRGTKLEPYDREMEINTLGGTMRAVAGDFIIKGIQGEYYPCKPDIFEKTYEYIE